MSQLQLRQHSKKKQIQKKRQHQDIYSHSSLLNNLHSGRHSEPVYPIQEGSATIEVGETPVQPPVQADHEVCVASFPAIISHEHFLNKELVNRPYLTLVFTLLQYRQD